MPNLIDPNLTRKRCVDCDKLATWSNWFCPRCGGRLTDDRPEKATAVKGRNRILTFINDRAEDIVVQVPPDEIIRVQPGQILNIPVAEDGNSIIRARADGSMLLGLRAYAETGADLKRTVEAK